MKKLLSIEFQKIWKNKASRVLLLTYFVLLSFIALIASIKNRPASSRAKSEPSQHDI